MGTGRESSGEAVEAASMGERTSEVPFPERRGAANRQSRRSSRGNIIRKSVFFFNLFSVPAHFRRVTNFTDNSSFRAIISDFCKKSIVIYLWFSRGYFIMISGSKGLNSHELAHKWVKDLGTRKT